MKAAISTLGCKVNQYDTQVMRERLEADGYQIIPFEEDGEADVYIINTCTVTHQADRKSRQQIARVRRSHPNAILVVCGCFAQTAPEEAAALEGVDIVLGTARRAEIVQHLDVFRATGRQVVAIGNSGTLEQEEIHTFSDRTRAMLKVEDGCDRYCSYCLIPFARGPVRSKPPETVRREAEDLAKAGYRELVLTGIHLASYGRDWGAPCLEQAVQATAVPGIRRIRLGSLEPAVVTEQLLDALRAFPQLCPHFHLSLQSGCDRTLQAMRRRYTAADYAAAAALLRAAYPQCALTTDIIVGFPGETDADFEESLHFAEQMGFAKIHIFPYSPRAGTRAATMPDQISAEVKRAREARMKELEERLRMAFWSRLVGSVQEVLPERQDPDGTIHGLTPCYSPVAWRGRETEQPVQVRITEVNPAGLLGFEL